MLNLSDLYFLVLWVENYLFCLLTTCFLFDVSIGLILVEQLLHSWHGLKNLQKLIWIGPVKFKSFSQCTNGMSEMARMINEQCANDCDVTVVGSTACEAIMKGSSSIASLQVIENASVFWEFLEGGKLPGVLALDRVFSSFLFNCSLRCQLWQLTWYLKVLLGTVSWS